MSECSFLPTAHTNGIYNATCAQSPIVSPRFARAGDYVTFNCSVDGAEYVKYVTGDGTLAYKINGNTNQCEGVIKFTCTAATSCTANGFLCTPLGNGAFAKPAEVDFHTGPVPAPPLSPTDPEIFPAKKTNLTLRFKIDDAANAACHTTANPDDGPWAGVWWGWTTGDFAKLLPFNIGANGFLQPGENDRNKRRGTGGGGGGGRGPGGGGSLGGPGGKGGSADGDCSGALPSTSLVSPNLSYNSDLSNSAPASLGYGWSLDGLYVSVSYDSVSSTLTFNDGHGSFEKWQLVNGAFKPLYPDNYIVATQNVDGTYQLQFPNQTLFKFQADNRLKYIVDRNNNTTTYFYNGPQGSLSSIEDGEGRVLFVNYGSRTDGQPDNIREQSNIDGPITQFQYYATSPNRLWKVTNPAGETQEYFYVDSGPNTGKLKQVKDATGAIQLEYEYGNDGKVTSVIHYGKYKVTYEESVDVDGNTLNLVRHFDSLSSQTPVATSRLTLNGRLLLIKREEFLVGIAIGVSPTNEARNTWLYEYQDLENPYLQTKLTEANETDVRVTSWTYGVPPAPNDPDAKKHVGTLGLLKSFTDVAGNTTVYNYCQETEDPVQVYKVKHKDLVSEVIYPMLSQDTTVYKDQFTYDDNGNRKTAKDRANNTTVFSYDTSPGTGRVVSIEDRNHNITSYTYTDATDQGNRGNLKTITTPAGPGTAPARTKTFLYYSAINPNSNTDPGAPRNYDHLYRILRSGTANTEYSERTWDPIGRPKRLTNPLTKYTQFNYTSGRLLSQDLPSNITSGATRRQTSFSYSDAGPADAPGQKFTVFSKVNATQSQMRSRSEYDNLGRLNKFVKLQGGVERNYLSNYDALHRLISSQDPLNRQSTQTYSQYCKTLTVTSPSGLPTLTQMDGFCRPIWQSVPEEDHAMEYDNWGRLVKTTQRRMASAHYASAMPINPLQSVYDFSRYDGAAVTDEVTQFEYYPTDQLKKITYPDGKTQQYTYDAEGRLISSMDPNGMNTVYEYYNDNRLYKVNHKRPNLADLVFTYSYDAVGRLYEIIYPTASGIVARFYDASNNSGWDAADQLLWLRYTKDGNPLLSLRYYYDDSGNRIQMDQVASGVSNTWTYGYDWLNRLTSVTKNGTLEVSYQYDESDNRVQEVRGTNTRVFTYDAADQLIQQTLNGSVVENYLHNLDGQMISRTTGGVTTQYSWDQNGNLKKIDGATTGSEQIYDVNGIRRLANGKSFYSSGAVSVADSDSVNVSYMQGHVLLGSTAGSNVVYYLTDGLSSVKMLCDGTGALQATLDYGEYGQPSASSNSPHTYVGGLGVRNEGNLLYIRRRWYDPQLGRFLSPDPIGFAGGLNQYGYVGGNPINNTDPSGLNPGIVLGGPTAEILVTGVVVYAGYQILHQPISQALQNFELPNIPPEIQQLLMTTQPATLQETLTVTGGFINVTPGTTVLGGSISSVSPLINVYARNDGKKNKDDAPGWVKTAYAGGNGMLVGETVEEFLERIFSKQYPGVEISTGAGGEYSRSKKAIEQKHRQKSKKCK